MVLSYSDKIGRAKRERQKKSSGIFLAILCMFVFLCCMFSYLNRVQIIVSYDGYETNGLIAHRSGVSFLAGNYLYPLIGGSVLEIKFVGYHSEEIKIIPGSVKEYQVKLKLLDKNLTLMTENQLSSPAWSVNGNIVGFSNSLNLNIRPGIYDVSLFAEGINEQTRRVEFFPNEIDDQLVFSPEIENLQLKIVTSPSNAQINIGGNEYGVSPLVVAVDPQLAGEKVTLFLGGYQTITQILEPQNGLYEREFTFQFVKKGVKLQISPPGGVLIVNGERIDTAIDIQQIELYVDQSNIVNYSKYGYHAIEVKPEGVAELAINLEPVMSRVNIDSSPSAEIIVDGLSVGFSPLLIDMQIGKHEVELVAPGYVGYKSMLNVVESSLADIDVQLESMFDFLDRSSPSIYQNPLNIKLVKVQGADITLGAPRNERGQRANETLRPVSFKRKFYVSEAEITADQFSKFDTSKTASQLPVTSISWLDAIRFCNWLSELEGLEPFYSIESGNVYPTIDSLGYRLPTEAEWEFIARRLGRREQTIFAWGDDYVINSAAGNIADASAEGLAVSIVGSYNDGNKSQTNVKSFAATNAFFDLSGNVSEFVTDHYNLLPPDSVRRTDYIDLSRSRQRVLKGSNYLSASWTELRGGFREPVDIDEGRPDVGFRIARYVH